MSSNLKRPLTKLAGTVRRVEQQVSIYMVTVEIDERIKYKKIFTERGEAKMVELDQFKYT